MGAAASVQEGKQELVSKLANKQNPIPVAERSKIAPTQKDKELESTDSNFNKICVFLRDQFVKVDKDLSDDLDHAEFLKLMASIDFSKLGFSQDETDLLVECCENVTFSHTTLLDVVDELAESIQSILESQGRDASFLLNEGFDGLGPQHQRGCDTTPPELLLLLQDTFDEYDLDGSGTLDLEEFWQMIQAINLPLGSKYEMFAQWDSFVRDNNINWVEAIFQIEKKIHELNEDGEDHWIGLVDKSSQFLFWYNLKDKASVWMSEDDQNAYRAHKLNAPEVVAPVYVYPTQAIPVPEVAETSADGLISKTATTGAVRTAPLPAGYLDVQSEESNRSRASQLAEAEKKRREDYDAVIETKRLASKAKLEARRQALKKN